MKAELIKWSSVFETGILKLDIQHKVIVTILNELYNIILGNVEEDKLNELIQELTKYTKYHFEEEEKLFDKYNFPEKEEHLKEHDEFNEKVDGFINKLNNDPDTDKSMLAIEIMEFLKNWLTEHILETDQKYVKHFKKNKL